jgi:hypothetical protein
MMVFPYRYRADASLSTFFKGSRFSTSRKQGVRFDAAASVAKPDLWLQQREECSRERLQWLSISVKS